MSSGGKGSAGDQSEKPSAQNVLPQTPRPLASKSLQATFRLDNRHNVQQKLRETNKKLNQPNKKTIVVNPQQTMFAICNFSAKYFYSDAF